jgi:hypothetical protein
MYESHYTSPNKKQNAMYVTTDPRQFQSARKLNASILDNKNNANSVTYFKSLENNYPAMISSHQHSSMLSHPHQTGEAPHATASPYYNWKNEGGIMNNQSIMKDATSKQMLRKKKKTSIENLATWQ